jgi:predicted nucleic acid-binding protein
VIIADTGAILALVNKSDRHHGVMRDLYNEDPDEWLLPWAILPEVDYLLGSELGARAQDAFLADLSDGAFAVEYGDGRDVMRAHELNRRYRALRMGLVDGVVMAMAERLGARAIATVDLRHFGAVELHGSPQLLPRTSKRPG